MSLDRCARGRCAALFLCVLLSLALPICSWSAPPQRLVSLAPSITEVLYALGAEDRLVGVTEFCDRPAAARRKPKVGGMANPSLEAVIRVRPDLVIVTTNGNPQDFEERLRGLGIRTHVFRARRLAEFPREIRLLGTVVGAEGTAEALARSIEAAFVRLRQHRAPASPKLKALFVVWPEPLIVAGTGSTADEALSLLGIENIAAGTLTEYPKYSIEDILRQAPDIIFIGQGTGMDSVSDGLLKKLKGVPAVRHNRVFYVSDALYRIGPRTIGGVEELARHLH